MADGKEFNEIPKGAPPPDASANLIRDTQTPIPRVADNTAAPAGDAVVAQAKPLDVSTESPAIQDRFAQGPAQGLAVSQENIGLKVASLSTSDEGKAYLAHAVAENTAFYGSAMMDKVMPQQT